MLGAGVWRWIRGKRMKHMIGQRISWIRIKVILQDLNLNRQPEHEKKKAAKETIVLDLQKMVSLAYPKPQNK